MPSPYILTGLIHAAVALYFVRKYVIYCRRNDELEEAIPVLIISLFGLPLTVFLWPGVWVIAALGWIAGLFTIPEAIRAFHEIRKELE